MKLLQITNTATIDKVSKTRTS